MPRHADPNARDALIAAARAEFAKRSLRGARIEDITAASGLSKGAFYLHFESKESLFGELVEAFFGELTRCTEGRKKDMLSFVESHGAITRRDIEHRTPRYQQLLELEAAEDLRVLEHMWAYRDVVGVLFRGAQGTQFENALWDVTDLEVQRIRDNVDKFQGEKLVRADIPPEIFGSMIVGTYTLLALRMSRMQEKPDLAEWARSLHTLIREGSAPAENPPANKSVPRSAS
jgi:AcrR family transcriptional regulator